MFGFSAWCTFVAFPFLLFCFFSISHVQSSQPHHDIHLPAPHYCELASSVHHLIEHKTILVLPHYYFSVKRSQSRTKGVIKVHWSSGCACAALLSNILTTPASSLNTVYKLYFDRNVGNIAVGVLARAMEDWSRRWGLVVGDQTTFGFVKNKNVRTGVTIVVRLYISLVYIALCCK